MDAFGETRMNDLGNRGRHKKSNAAAEEMHSIGPASGALESKALARIRAVETRMASRAARELLGNLVDYRELPRRLERFCQHLDDGCDVGSIPPTAAACAVVMDDRFDDATSSSGNNRLAWSDRTVARDQLRDATAAVLATAPASFFECVTRMFQAWISAGVDDADDDDEDNRLDDGDWERLSKSMFKLKWMAPPRHSHHGGAGGGLVRPYWHAALERTVMLHVQNAISGDYSQAFLPELRSWSKTVEAWIGAHAAKLLNASTDDDGDGDDEENDPVSISDWDDRAFESHGGDPSVLQTILDECYCRVRMQEIFDVVAEYPDSHVAVVELRDVLSRTGWHGQLALQLQAQLVKRLNHPGANTSQIIDVYIAVIKVLGVLDPTTSSSMALASSLQSSSSATNLAAHKHRVPQHRSMPLLSVVAGPVRKYLCSRTDTVRCIISSLTDSTVGGDLSLYRELKRQDAKPLENVVVDSDDEEECPSMSWQPPPPIWSSRRFGNPVRSAVLGTTEAASPAAAAAAADSDILAMLVSIYGSKEVFVDEYRVMLADKLLALSQDYNTDQAVHTLELLKLRFSEASMRNCEVMIKDMDDSKRTIANIHSTLKSAAAVDVAMISHIFWPPLQNEPLKHHPRLQAMLDAFGGEYARLKNPRKLIWLDQLGTVDLELDCIDDTGENTTARSFSCTPLLATVISHFEDKTSWSLEELSNETSVPTHILQKKISYWVNQRVLIQSRLPGGSVAYELASTDHHLQEHLNGRAMHPYTSHAAGGSGPLHVLDDDDDGVAAVSSSAQAKAEMEVYESYIVGMLTNAHGGLQLSRIHTMLQTFVSGSDTKYNKTLAQLSAFLQMLCQQEKLECGPDGMYKLFKRHQ
jgi:anaphase-promoting complex subunit 2